MSYTGLIRSPGELDPQQPGETLKRLLANPLTWLVVAIAVLVAVKIFRPAWLGEAASSAVAPVGAGVSNPLGWQG